ncbi:MAG: phenylalanine--tRNA ligase subunit beta [Gemmatimonadota bacterium]
MKVSYRWLRELAPAWSASVAETVERLALRGTPVEEVVDLAEGLRGVVVGRVVEAGRHPGADRLSLCRVDAGGPELLSVVCGAPNVRAGGHYPFAPVGTTLPGGLTLKKAKIRGEVSEGMLCSEQELGLGDSHAGILEIPAFTPGMPFVEALGLDDARLDVEVTANRPDLLSHRGIARELAGESALVLPPIPDGRPFSAPLRTDGRRAEAAGVSITVEAPELCPRYLGAVVRGVRVGPSPAWLQARLRAAGARPINNVVDATNYVLLELGQPLHAFDLARLAGSAIVVRTARPGERLVTLDGVTRTLSPSMLAICDAERPVAVAGVMGGEESEVSTGTTDVLLECALFEPRQVRATRRALDMVTDASYRYERGVDPELQREALARAVEIVVATAGGEPDAEVLEVAARPWSRRRIPVRPARVRQVLGIDVSHAQTGELLQPLGFVDRGLEDGNGVWEVPGHRSWDVTREIDVIEEIARTYGYDRFPDTLGAFRPSTVPDHPLFQLEDRVRRLLVGKGLFEIHTLAFARAGSVRIPNPLSTDGTHLRDSLLPGLLRALEHNFNRGQRNLRFFEIGTVFHAGPVGEKPRESTRLAVVLTGARHPEHWSGAREPLDFWDAKGVLEAVLEAVGEATPGGEVRGEGASHPVLEGVWQVGEGEHRLALAGRVRPAAMDAPAWADPVWGFELELPAEGAPARVRPVRPLPAFPAVERDLALLVPVGATAGTVREAIVAAAGPLLERVELFDVYEGAGVPEGRRSLAWRLRFQAPDRTLRDGDVEGRIRRILSALKEALDVDART